LIPLNKQSRNWIYISKTPKNGVSIDESYTYKQDDNYNLYISRYYKDTVNRINYRINLSRHFGNTAILKLIKDELESQLESFKKDFDEL